MKGIRPLERADLPALAALYADFVGWDPDASGAALNGFFSSVLLDHPQADPGLPSLVFEASGEVVGFIGSHPRPYRLGDRAVRVVSSGPLVVDPRFRAKGVGALLLRQFLAGPQELTVNDRSIDAVHEMWQRLGGLTDGGMSVGWSRTLRPVGQAVGNALGRGRRARLRPRAGKLVAGVDRGLRRLRAVGSPTGGSQPLTPAAAVALLDGLQRHFPLLPAYDEPFLEWLFERMEGCSVGEQLVRRLVLDGDGEPSGAYVMYVTPHGAAEVVFAATAPAGAPALLDHAAAVAADAGAVEIRGRVEPQLLGALRAGPFRFVRSDWSTLHSSDETLVNAALSGRMLVSRMDGEWWMRPVLSR